LGVLPLGPSLVGQNIRKMGVAHQIKTFSEKPHVFVCGHKVTLLGSRDWF